MASSSYVQTAFFGGEISQLAQGRMDSPSYKVSLNVCLNMIPIESGALMRRPGTRHAAVMRGGAQGRGIKFDFAQNFPYMMQFTDGFLRATTGPALVMTNDSIIVAAMSSANPTVVQTNGAHGWATGNTIVFGNYGATIPTLQNRQFLITVIDATHFSLADAITGASIDGSIGFGFAGGTIVSRVMEIVTPYTTGSWASLRSVQAETRTVLLNGTHPQVLQVATPPTQTQFATFTFGASDFIDGPYLDPIPGSFMSSSALNGVVTLTLSFQAYDATRAYNVGDFVSDVGVSYRSLTTLNQAHTPASSPSNWAPVNAGAAVNNGIGFQSSDIGRLIRLLSEPALWNSGSTYSTGNVVAYADGFGGFSYWTATAAISAGIQPGTSTLWAINATGAEWTWAQVVSVSGSGLIAPATAIGSLGGGGGLPAAFDGNTTKPFASAANFSIGITTFPSWGAGTWAFNSVCQYGGIGYKANYDIIASSIWSNWQNYILYAIGQVVQFGGFIYRSGAVNNIGIQPPNSNFWTLVYAVSTAPPPYSGGLWSSFLNMSSPTEDVYVGQHYGTPQAIQSATLYPTTDAGISPSATTSLFPITVNLRAKSTAPSSAADGTLLGTTGAIGNTVSPVTIVSNDNVTTWNYVWFEITATYLQPLPDSGNHSFDVRIGVGQAQFFAPSTSNGSVVTAQIRGPALLYAQTIRTWRLGVYSDTTGWPTCGTYHEGRIWFGGVVPNRFDGSMSNGLNGVQLAFAPTSSDGTVSGNNAISYVCTGEDSNQILWMTPDQQGIIFGTKAGEWLISAPSAGPLAPTNIKAVRVTKIGCANIEPRRAEHTLLIVQKFGRKVVEYFADVFSGKFTAPNLSERAKHLTVNGIAEIAYQQELAPTMWCRRNDGALIGATYKRDTLTTSQGPTIIGWHRHQLGSGRFVESLCVGPSVGGNLDAVSLITNDGSTGVRHIEVMTDLLDEGFLLTDCWFLDDAIVPTSTVVQAVPTGGPYGSLLVNGLWPHNGKTVSAYIAGLDCGDYVVANGSITIPFGDSVSGGTANGLFTAALVASFPTLPAVVGFTYNSDGQLIRPVTQADTGAQAGPGFAKLGRQHLVAAQVYGVVNGSLQFGVDFQKIDPVRLRDPADTPYTIQQQWSGIWRQGFDASLDFDGMICWRISRPNPAFVIAVGGFMAKSDA